MCGLAEQLPAATDGCRRRLDAAMDSRVAFLGYHNELAQRQQALLAEREQLLGALHKV
jgi:hypothetical protein